MTPITQAHAYSEAYKPNRVTLKAYCILLALVGIVGVGITGKWFVDDRLEWKQRAQVLANEVKIRGARVDDLREEILQLGAKLKYRKSRLCR